MPLRVGGQTVLAVFAGAQEVLDLLWGSVQIFNQAEGPFPDLLFLYNFSAELVVPYGYTYAEALAVGRRKPGVRGGAGGDGGDGGPGGEAGPGGGGGEGYMQVAGGTSLIGPAGPDGRPGLDLGATYGEGGRGGSGGRGGVSGTGLYDTATSPLIRGNVIRIVRDDTAGTALVTMPNGATALGVSGGSGGEGGAGGDGGAGILWDSTDIPSDGQAGSAGQAGAAVTAGGLTYSGEPGAPGRPGQSGSFIQRRGGAGGIGGGGGDGASGITSDLMHGQILRGETLPAPWDNVTAGSYWDGFVVTVNGERHGLGADNQPRALIRLRAQPP